MTSMQKFRLLVIAVAALGVAAAIALHTGSETDDFVGGMVADIGGPFHLASSNGGLVDSKDLLGKPYGVFFGFTHCPEVCPTTLFDMSRAMKAAEPVTGEFRLFFITVDPERDTAPMLKDYLSNFDPRIEALVPTPEELKAVAKEFRAIYEKVPASEGQYTMNHTATVFLINRQGKLAGTISYDEKPEIRVRKLQKLMGAS
jgi:protein SCO1/2